MPGGRPIRYLLATVPTTSLDPGPLSSWVTRREAPIGRESWASGTAANRVIEIAGMTPRAKRQRALGIGGSPRWAAGAAALAGLVGGVALLGGWAPAVVTPHAVAPAPVRAEGLGPKVHPTAFASKPHSVPCLDLPISGAAIAADSCWQLGPTATVVAGTKPGSVAEGELALINGQSMSLHVTPGSGPLVLKSAGSTTACARAGNGLGFQVNVANGSVTSVGRAACHDQNRASSPSANVSLASTQRTSVTLLQAVSPLAPSVTPSYYEYYSYLQDCALNSTTGCPPYEQGQATYTPSTNGLLVLDFGAPCYVVSSGAYGSQMFGNSVCVPDSTLRGLVSDWIRGYESDHGAGTHNITVAVGTSNSLNGVDPGYALSGTQMQASGQYWYQQLVGAVGTGGMAAPVTLWAGSDVEQSSSGNWYSATASVAWVTGYSNATPAAYSCSLSTPGFMVDYGDDVLGGTGSGDGWTASQVYQVAWGIRSACALPEIYYTGMAAEWAALSQWGSQYGSAGGIVFTGVMTEPVSGSYSPTAGWQQLQSGTGQAPPIPTLTEIGTSLQGPPPTISGISPSYGPESGATTVTITGKNLLGLEAVDFGGTPATSFTSVSASSVTAVTPAATAGIAAVVIETSMGTSAVTASSQFQYLPPPCTSVSVSPGANPVAPGYAVTVSAQSTCPAGASPKYSYFVRPADSTGAWTLEAAWIGPTWTWGTAGLPLGTYDILAWVSDGPYSAPQVQQYTEITLSTTCTAVAVTVSPQAQPGAVVAVSAQASCPPGAAPEYSYFIRPAASSAPWQLEAAWIGSSWAWRTWGLATGSYQILAWASGGPYGSPQVQGVGGVTLAWPTPCSSVSVSSPTTAVPGASVAVWAQATCPVGAVPKYSYFIRSVGSSGPWTLEAAWIGPTWAWTPAANVLGSYDVLAWASDGPYGIPQVQEVTEVTFDWPLPCSSVTVSATSNVTQGSGDTISAIATCPAGTTAEYSYFVRPVGSTAPWTLEAAWVGPSWTWSTSGVPLGNYDILAWASDGPFTLPQVGGVTVVDVS